MSALCSRYLRARSQWQESSELAERTATFGILLGMPLQIARRVITVGARLRRVAFGAAVLLGSATADG